MGPNQKIHLISFPPESYTIVKSSNYWKPHPDGIGYLHEWMPINGPVIIVTGNSAAIAKSVNSFNMQARASLQALKVKRELGELDERSYQTRIKDVKQSIFQTVSKWASEL